jgi:hypothetical protein
LIAFMQAITTAFPDWSFNGHVLHEENLAEQCWNVLYVTAMTGTNTRYLSLPTLPVLPPTGRRVVLEPGTWNSSSRMVASKRSTPTSRPAGWRKSSRSWI